MLFKRQHNRKWQERPLLYKGRFFYLRRLAQVSLAIFTLVVITALFLYFKNSDALRVKNVKVIGAMKHVEAGQVIALSQIQNSNRLFGLRMGVIRQNVLRHPWVDDVRVRREFPDTIQIEVVEKTPIAILQADEMYLVDQRQSVFKKLEASDPKDLPVISGFGKVSALAHPALTRYWLRGSLVFLNFLQKQAFYKEDPVSEVAFDPVFGFSVFTQNRGLEIHYGLNSYAFKQARLEKFKLSKNYRDTTFVRLDLDLPDRIVARQ